MGLPATSLLHSLSPCLPVQPCALKLNAAHKNKGLACLHTTQDGLAAAICRALIGMNTVVLQEATIGIALQMSTACAIMKCMLCRSPTLSTALQ